MGLLSRVRGQVFPMFKVVPLDEQFWRSVNVVSLKQPLVDDNADLFGVTLNTSDSQEAGMYKVLLKILEGHKGFIAGGIFKDIMLCNVPKDVDVFFNCEQDFWEAVESFENSGLNRIYSSENSVGFKFEDPYNSDDPSFPVTIDLIRKIFGSPETILKTFDFTVCQRALVRDGDSYCFVEVESFQNDLDGKVLRFYEDFSVVADSLLRVHRYVGYGFHPSDEMVVEALRVFLNSIEDLKNYASDDVVKNYKLWDSVGFSSLKFFVEDLPKLYLSADFNNGTTKGVDSGSFNNNFLLRNNMVRGVDYLMNGRGMKDELDALDKKLSNYVGFSGNGYSCISLPTLRLYRLLDKFKHLVSVEDLKKVLCLSFCCQFVLPSWFSRARFKESSEPDAFDCSVISWDEAHKSKNCGYLFHTDPDNPYVFDSPEVLCKAFSKFENDVEWFKSCVSFFADFSSGGLSYIPTLKEWHESVDSGVFDPDMAPSIMTSLMVEEDDDDDDGFTETLAILDDVLNNNSLPVVSGGSFNVPILVPSLPPF